MKNLLGNLAPLTDNELRGMVDDGSLSLDEYAEVIHARWQLRFEAERQRAINAEDRIILARRKGLDV